MSILYHRMGGFITSVLLLTACAPITPPAAVPAPRAATPVVASFGKTWDAVIDVFAQQNIPIKTLERSSGFIVAEEATVPLATGASYADCGKAFGRPIAPNRANYNVRVKGDSTQATVQLNVMWKDTNYPYGKVVECTSNGSWEAGVESAIRILAQSR